MTRQQTKSNVEHIIVQVTVLEGEGLAAKDRNLLGRKTSSDPYCEIHRCSHRRRAQKDASKHGTSVKVGSTPTRYKTLNPNWGPNAPTFVVIFKDDDDGDGENSSSPESSEPSSLLLLKLFDEDKFSSPDAMGEIVIPITEKGISTDWYDVIPNSAKNAKGRLKVRLDVTIVLSKPLVRGNQFPLTTSQLQVGLAWDVDSGKAVDLDVSCVALDQQGQICMDDTIYYGNQSNANHSIWHSGDEQVGDDDGDDETIGLDLSKLPPRILCLYVILTVATPRMRIADIQSTTLRVYDTKKRCTLCKFTPAQKALHQDATALFLCRISRTHPGRGKWILSTIEDTHPTARDFGSLIPYVKSYTRDILPDLDVDPTERVAILRKGATVRLADYATGGHLPSKVTFGLAWDVTEGVDIDLDASAICFGANLEFIDRVFFKKLKSDDGAIVHNGDEREGDEIGDDETMDLYLDRVNSEIKYIGFVINSYSGQELDDVDRAFCHLFGPNGTGATGNDMASYAMTNSESLDGFTALLVGCLYRGNTPGEWCLHIMAKPVMGKTSLVNVQDLKDYLQANPLEAPDMLVEDAEIELSAMMEMPMVVPLVDEEIDLS